MKKLLLILLCLPMIGFGQEALDTIFYRDWSKKTVKIIEVTKSDVVFQYPSETIKNTESTNKIASITFSSGRIKKLNKEIGLHPDTLKLRKKVKNAKWSKKYIYLNILTYLPLFEEDKYNNQFALSTVTELGNDIFSKKRFKVSHYLTYSTNILYKHNPLYNYNFKRSSLGTSSLVKYKLIDNKINVDLNLGFGYDKMISKQQSIETETDSLDGWSISGHPITQNSWKADKVRITSGLTFSKEIKNFRLDLKFNFGYEGNKYYWPIAPFNTEVINNDTEVINNEIEVVNNEILERIGSHIQWGPIIKGLISIGYYIEKGN